MAILYIRTYVRILPSFKQDEWAKVSTMASWWPPHIYQSKSWRNLRISEFRKKQLSSTSAYNCPIHNFKIANNQQRFSLHVDKVHYKYTAVNSSFCKQAFLISPALPTPPWSGVWRPLKSHYHWRSHRWSGTDVRQSGKSQKPCFPS